MNYRKIGGIHWISIGQLRISFCRSRKGTKIPAGLMPLDLATAQVVDLEPWTRLYGQYRW